MLPLMSDGTNSRMPPKARGPRRSTRVVDPVVLKETDRCDQTSRFVYHSMRREHEDRTGQRTRHDLHPHHFTTYSSDPLRAWVQHAAEVVDHSDSRIRLTTRTRAGTERCARWRRT